MSKVGTLEVVITGDAQGLKKAAGVAKQQMKGLGKGMKGLERGLGNIADLGTAAMLPTMGALGALGLFVGQAVSAFSEHEQRMSDVSTLLSGTSEEIDKTTDQLTEGVREIGAEAPKSLGDLEAALYQIISAGIDAADANDVLNASAKLATAGLGTTSEAADILTSALNSYGLSTEDVDSIAAVFFETVKRGKTTISELSASFGSVAPIASYMGVSLEELNAATAALTTTGLSASESQTSLRATMTQLLKPGKDLEEVLMTLGVESGPRFEETLQALIEKDGLVTTLDNIRKSGKEMGYSLGELFGSVESLLAIVTLTETKNETFNDTLKAMQEESAKTSDEMTNLDRAFEAQAGTVKSTTQIMRNEIDAWLQDVGEVFVQFGYDFVLGWKRIFEDSGKVIEDIKFSILSIFGGPEVASRIESIGGIFDFLTNAAGNFKIPGLAEGGIVTSPTLAMVGENGPEAIVPLSGGMSGAGMITIAPTIIIESASLSSEIGIEETARKVADLMSEILSEEIGV